jgi:hypothetical protein
MKVYEKIYYLKLSSNNVIENKADELSFSIMNIMNFTLTDMKTEFNTK